MEKSKEEELEIFIKKTIKEVGVETPSPNFTDSVLANISRQVTAEKVPYAPIISKTKWFWTIILLVGAVVSVMFTETSLNLPWLASFEIPSLSNGILNSISSLKISNTYLYGVVGVTFFVTVQVFVLKNYINKRYAM